MASRIRFRRSATAKSTGENRGAVSQLPEPSGSAGVVGDASIIVDAAERIFTSQPDGNDYVDPSSLTGDSADSSANGGTAAGDSGSDGSKPKRRGRPPGSRNKNGSAARPTARSREESTQALTQILYTVHLMGAQLLKMNELQLSESESKQLAGAMNRVAELYDMPEIAEKTTAWIALVATAGIIYGPRVVEVKRKSAEAKKPKPLPFTVIPAGGVLNE